MKFNSASSALVCVCLLLTFIPVNSRVKAPGLYKASDAVFILNQNNFKENVIECESAWIVEFYNSWCGHCINFAPVWKEFALQHEGWWPLVRVGAVDCADDTNTELCRKYDIKGFPAFKLFEPGYNGTDKTKTFHDQNKSFLEWKLLDFASNSSLFKVPKSWPRLFPIESMQDIWDETKDEHHHVAFIFEEPQSVVGRQVILDTFRYKPLLVRRMLKKSVVKFGITDFPSLYLINRDGTFTRMAKNDNSREGMVSALKGLLTAAQREAGEQYINQRHRNQPAEESKDREPAANSQETREAVYMTDLESTLHYSLRQEIAICRDISGQKLTALKQFMKVLAKYFPGREEVTGLLQKVSVWLKTAGDELTGDQWINTLDEIQTMEDYIPESIEWVGCAGSEQRFRGYPCGMWTLFHTLTVAAYQKGRENPKDLPLDILDAIQNYMKYFFGCQICVEHFLKMAGRITSNDKTPDGTVLWLWQAHNMANKRLHGDQSEDPKHPKIQFPSRQMCPKCYDGEGWDKDKVLKFLVTFYGKQGIVPVSDNSEKGILQKTSLHGDDKNLDWWELHQRKKDLEKIQLLRQQKVEKQKQRKVQKFSKLDSKKRRVDLHDAQRSKQERNLDLEQNSAVIYGWGFSNLDMSMCITFYVLCTFAIMVLYYHFIVRRKYRPWTVLW